jgi:hypothetical protein
MAEKRPIRISDLLILAALTAAGVALCKLVDDRWDAVVAPDPQAAAGPLAALRRANHSLPALLTAWSVAQILIRLQRPRPAFQQTFRYVGTSANASALIVVLCGLVDHTISLVLGLLGPVLPWDGDDVDSWVSELEGLPWGLSVEIGGAIVAVWLILALAGHLRLRGGGWPEAFGTVLGFGWILVLIDPWR